jgi:hypothetical protein
MKRSLHSYYPEPFGGTSILKILSGQFYSRLIRLCPAVAEKDPVCKRMLYKPLGQGYLGPGIIEI